MKLYYLGPTGSFSHSALRKIAPHGDLVPLSSFSDIISRVLIDETTQGLLVIENTNSSSIHECIDLLFHNDIHIVSEVFLEISLHLIGIADATLEQVKEVYSHPQAFAQCGEFIKKHNLKMVPTESTAQAVQEISRLQDASKMALAGTDALIDTKAHIVKGDIADVSSNMTRWVMVSRNPKAPSEYDNKMTVLLQVKHEPGSLVRVLSAVAKKNGNLTKIESRPVPGSSWEYAFWVDLEIPVGSAHEFTTLFSQETREHRIVGIYEKGNTYETD